jgi:hypothetical protein
MKKVRYLTYENKISNEECEVLGEIEEKGLKCFRLKKPNGEILRIFHDRIRPIKEEEMNEKAEIEFSPWTNNPKEVWMVESNFGNSAICETYTLIYDDKYTTVNVYNKLKANGFCNYELKDYNKLIKKLEKKGYKKINK